MGASKLTPDMATLVALGSLAVHIEEYLVSERENPNAAAADRSAIDTLLAMSSLRRWLSAMDAVALLPQKR
jgi:hypothetical protein